MPCSPCCFSGWLGGLRVDTGPVGLVCPCIHGMFWLICGRVPPTGPKRATTPWALGPFWPCCFFLVFQVSTGLISDDEIANAGPLTALVSGSWVSWASAWHKNWGKLIIIGLVALHLTALVWSRYRKHQALVSAMWHGFKDLPEWVTGSNDHLKSRSLAFVLFLIAAGIVFGIVSLAQ